jgi:hypothetical protein
MKKKKPKQVQKKGKSTSNGKGDSPRSCYSRKFKDNYDSIDWGKKKKGS